MRFLKRIAVAFSLYSRIPMPQFKWTEADMKYNLVILPFVGIVIGAFQCGVIVMSVFLSVPMIAKGILLSIVPIMVTGGFHMDGFLDVCDARKSFASKEKKLEILKDPHIGAFAIIKLLEYILLWAAAMVILLSNGNYEVIMCFTCIFFVSRSLNGVVQLSLKKARTDGMLNMETRNENRLSVVILSAFTVAGLIIMSLISIIAGVIDGILLTVFVIYYKKICQKEFGGVTGDTAGYFVVVSELLMLIGIAVSTYIVWA